MPKINKKDLLERVQGMDMDEKLKEEIINRLNEIDELDDLTVAWVKEKLQQEFDKTADEILGDEKDTLEYKKAEKEMEDGLQSALNTFSETMDEIEDDAQKVKQDILKQLDKANIKETKSKIDES